MINQAVIIPTGHEILDKTVIDTNSPMIRDALHRLNPDCQVQIEMAVADDQALIVDTVQAYAESGADLICLIGGSGGGHRHNASFSKDFTHSALEQLLPMGISGAIFGKNGHMWCKLHCGIIRQTLIINVPGPYQEAMAAIDAFCESYRDAPEDLNAHNKRMLAAVSRQYEMRSIGRSEMSAL